MNWKRKLDYLFFELLMKLSTILISFILLYIIFIIFQRGLPYLSWEMISQKPSGGSSSGEAVGY